MKRLCTAVIVAVAACGGPVESSGGDATPLISMHVASQEEESGLNAISFEGRELFAETEPILSDPDIVAVDPVRSEEGVILDLELTAAAAERLRNVTAGNIGRPLVVLFDEEVVGAPTIRSAIGGRAQLAVPASSAEEAREVIAQVRDRWPPVR